jgi:site-specific DNA recombinase
MKNETGYRIALYIRASTEEQCTLDGTIRNQEERLKAEVRYRSQNGPFGEIVGTYTDAGKSAKDMKRSELQKMLQAIKRKEVDLVMVTELSRLSRSVRDFVAMNDFFREHGCKFVSMKDQYDTSTAGGEMVMLTMANLAQFERRQVSERVSANFKARAERGLYNGGQVPMGYKLIPEKRGHLAVDSGAAETVRVLFEAFLREGTTSRAARWMNGNGYHAKSTVYGGGEAKPKTGHFTFQNVHDMLTNPVYIGVKRFQDKEGVREVKACWDAIVDPVTFERAQLLLKMNVKRKRPDYPNRFPFLLSGLVRCSECGVSMVGKTANGNGGKVGYYDHGNVHRRFQCTDAKPSKCTHVRVQAVKLEEAVWRGVEEHLKRPELARQLVLDATSAHKTDEARNEGAALKQKITHLKRRLEGLAGRLADLPPDISPEPVFALMRKTESEIKDVESRASELGPNSGMTPLPVELELYQSFIESLTQLNTAEASIREKIIELLVHKIVVLPDGFQIDFYGGEMEVERGLAHAGPRPSGTQKETTELFQVGGSKVLLNGGWGRNRTADTCLFRALLYRLSYPPEKRESFNYETSHTPASVNSATFRDAECDLLNGSREPFLEVYPPDLSYFAAALRPTVIARSTIEPFRQTCILIRIPGFRP